MLSGRWRLDTSFSTINTGSSFLVNVSRGIEILNVGSEVPSAVKVYVADGKMLSVELLPVKYNRFGVEAFAPFEIT